MRDIGGRQEAAKQIGSFSFAEFRRIHELRLYEMPREGVSLQMLDVVVESEGRQPNYEMTLTFGRVSQLELRGFGGGETRVVGLAIVDISDRQWEKKHWRVADYEEGKIAFFAETAEITAVRPARIAPAGEWPEEGRTSGPIPGEYPSGSETGGDQQ